MDRKGSKGGNHSVGSPFFNAQRKEVEKSLNYKFTFLNDEFTLMKGGFCE